MEYRTLGRTGFDASVVGFGGAPIGLVETEQKRVAGILDALLEEGVNVIDTAAGYSGSEAAIGKAVSRRRDDYVLVTKCGEPGADAESASWSPRSLSKTIDRSLRRLQTDRLDVVLLHSCPLETLQQGDALQAVVEARDAGKTRFVGYSGDNKAAAYAAGLDEVAVIETSVNICDQANIDMVLPVAQTHNVGVIAKRPIANAAWKDASEQEGFYAGYARTYSKRLSAMQVTPSELGFEGDPKEVWPEVALRFTLSQPGVHTAIVGTRNPEHARANIAAAEKGPLPEEAVRKLRAAFRDAEQRAGRRWRGQM